MTATKARQVNAPKLVELAEWAGAQHAREMLGLASEWDQGLWLRYAAALAQKPDHCGTAACLAGYTVLTDGWVPAPQALEALRLEPSALYELLPADDLDVSDVVDYEQESWGPGISSDYVCKVRYAGRGKDRKIAEITEARYVAELAREILGLNSDQADELFAPHNDFDDVCRIIGDLLADVPATELATL